MTRVVTLLTLADIEQVSIIDTFCGAFYSRHVHWYMVQTLQIMTTQTHNIINHQVVVVVQSSVDILQIFIQKLLITHSPVVRM